MRYLKQFLIILLVSFLGEILRYLIPLQIPASIYGLVLMLLALVTGVLKLDQVKETADFLIEIMPVMFIPAAVGIIDAWVDLRAIVVPVTVITVLTTFIVMIVAGRVTQFVIRGKKKVEEEQCNHD